jgi:8-oxo-dGTP pyrophosphatase MutT (NUDIX family)
MVVRHHQIDAFSGALVFPAASWRTPMAMQGCARCGGADKIADGELKFRIAGVREAFEECGILLARKRASARDRRRRPLAIELSGAPNWPRTRPASSTWRGGGSRDRHRPHGALAHWITPTFAPRRFDTWFFLAEAPRPDALHDDRVGGSVWIGAQQAIDEATAGRRTLVHATTKTSSSWPKAHRHRRDLSGHRAQDRHRPALSKAATANASSTSAGCGLPQPGEGDPPAIA